MFEYTICFIVQQDKVLLLNREKPSWMGSWNGVGGSLEDGETPEDCVLREVMEETAIKLEDVKFKGVVTWTVNGKPSGGMYAFISEIDESFEYDTPRRVDEGILDWKRVDWILHPKNTGIAHNLPYFLPIMLNDKGLYEHRCYFDGNALKKWSLNLWSS